MRVAIDAHMVGMRETGNEVYITNLIRALQSMEMPDIEFVILQTARSESPLDPARPAENFRVVRVIPANSFVRIPWSIPRQVRRKQVDVLHMTYNAPPWLSSSALVVSVHDLAYRLYPQYYSPRARLILSLLIPLSIRRAERVTTLSENSRQDIVREYGLSADKIVVTSAAASPEFQVVEDRRRLGAVRARYGLRESFVLAVGNLEPRKNLSGLVRAYAALRQSGAISQQLVIVGQAHWQGSAVSAEVKKLGLSREVVFTGYVPIDDLVMLYNAATVFVYPSLYEGFGLPILEAMSCGTPVITSNLASIPEVAGEAALLVSPQSEEDLAQVLGRVLVDESLRHKLREKGLRQAAQFSWGKTAHRLLEAYKDAMISHKNRRSRRR
ncbi:MAG: glycosyltransferase family 4 protein [Candidatus Thorarchaeota archaeon]